MAMTKTQVSQLYVTLFGRASEKEGNEYWATHYDNQYEAAKVMLTLDIVKDYFGDAWNDNKAFIESIYKNTLGKDPAKDQEGVNYWLNELNSLLKEGKSLTEARAKVVVDLINAVHEYENSDDPEAKAAALQFKNKVEVSDYTADKVEKVPGKTKEEVLKNLKYFKEVIANVTDDPATVEAAKKKVDEDLVVKNVALTTGKDIIKGSVFDDTFKADLLTLNDGDSIDGRDGNDTLNAQINANVSSQVTIKDVETINFTSYGAHQVDMKNITGAKLVKTVDSTGQLTLLNIASTDTGIGLKGLNQNISATYNDLSGANDELKLTLDDATNAQVTVNSGFETATITVDGDSSIKSFTNNPKKITVTGTGNLKLDDGGASNALGNNSISLFDASALKGSVTTGTDTNDDGFVDNENITTDASGTVIKLTDSADNVYINDGGNAGVNNTIFLNGGDDKLAIKKASGVEVVFGGDGDDSVKVVNASTAALTTSDIFNMGDGNDTLIIDDNQNNNFVVRGLENLVLTQNATGTNTVTSDTAIAVTAQVNNSAVDIRGLHSGSTVKVEDAKNATGGVTSLTVAFAQPEDSSTIEVDTKVADAIGNSLTLQNIKDATVNFNGRVAGTNSYAINTQGVTKLTINVAKAANFGNETDTASTDTLESIKIVGQDAVTIGNLTSAALKTVDISANKALSVGTATTSNLLSSVKYTSTNASVNFGNIGGASVTELSSVTINAKTNIGQTGGSNTINAIKIGDVALTAESGTLQVGDIGSSSTQSINSVTLKSAGNLTAANIDGVNTGAITITSTSGTVSGLTIGDNTTAGKFGDITVKGGGNVTVAKIGDSDDSFTNITVESTNGNITLSNGIDAKDSDGFDVVLRTSAATGTITANTIQNTDGNINSVTLSAKSTVTATVQVDDSGSTGGYYVKTVDATGVTGNLTLTVVNADDSAQVDSSTTIKLGGTTNTNNVTVKGKVDTLNITGSAGTDNITIGDGSDGGDADDTFKSGTIDLGAGTDKVDFTGYDNLDSNGQGLIINIDTSAHTVDGKVVSAGEVIEKDNNATDGTYHITNGTDIYLKNVENVVGTDDDDVIYGNAGNNTIDGGSGDDTIYGGAGTDIITGGAGDDKIYLGSSDGDTDKVKYSATGDVTNGDSIYDFETANDKLEFADGVWEGANYNNSNTWDKKVTVSTAGATGNSIAGADLVVFTANDNIDTKAEVDAMLDTQNGTFDGGVIVVTDNGTDTYVWYDSDADDDNSGNDVTLIAVLHGISDCSNIDLSNFIIN